MTSAEKTSIKITPIIAPMIIGYMYFLYTLGIWAVHKGEIEWGSGILAVVCYGFLVIHNFLQNAHSEKISLLTSFRNIL